MEFKKIMSTIIESEIEKHEQFGEKVVLKTLIKKRWLYTIAFCIPFVLFMLKDWMFPSFLTLLAYFIIMYNINNVSVITRLAKASPDKDISEIIKGDMK